MIKDESGNRRFYGVYRGVIVDTSDPIGRNRARLKVPQILLEELTGWAWPVHQVDVAPKTPPVGTAVWVMFEGGDPSFPMWLGSSQELPPSDIPFAVVGGTLETQPTFTGAPLFTGSYVKHGPMVHFRIDVDMDNITNFGSGQYYMNLPFTPKYNYQFTTGCFHDISTGNQYGIGGHVFAGNVQMRLTFTNSNGQDEAFDHNSPVTLNAADNFHISGDYITSE
jgi:hypothetical protein